jgi:hypothetical protein
MADERILNGIRRFWSRAQVESAYQTVLTAYSNAATLDVAIVGTSFDGQTANGQFVLDRAAMPVWMDVLEARLQELDGRRIAVHRFFQPIRRNLTHGKASKIRPQAQKHRHSGCPVQRLRRG